MQKNQTFWQRIKIAFLGIKTAFAQERNFRIQVFIGLMVMLLMLVLGVSTLEKSVLCLTILVVLSLELMNSQIEKFLDLIEPEHHPRVKIIKDFSAGAVLISVIGSVIVGALIFLPYLMYTINR